jgi:hypothetical protein
LIQPSLTQINKNGRIVTEGTRVPRRISFTRLKQVPELLELRGSLGGMTMGSTEFSLGTVSTKGIAGLRMKGLQRTCASARYTRFIVLPRFLRVWPSNSHACFPEKNPDHIGLFGNEDAQNPRPRSQEKPETQSTQNSRPALLPKIPMPRMG